MQLFNSSNGITINNMIIFNLQAWLKTLTEEDRKLFWIDFHKTFQ